jgi:hypothetical protein
MKYDHLCLFVASCLVVLSHYASVFRYRIPIVRKGRMPCLQRPPSPSHNAVCLNIGVHEGGSIILWWLDFRGEWRRWEGDVFAAVELDDYYVAIHVLAKAVVRLACIVLPPEGRELKQRECLAVEGCSHVGAGVAHFITLGVLRARAIQVWNSRGLTEDNSVPIVWKCGKIQIPGDDTNKSGRHSWWNQH